MRTEKLVVFFCAKYVAGLVQHLLAIVAQE
jgi:hypothetical protein